MWAIGIMNGYHYEIKHFDEGSVFGINDGKISKLFMSKDGVVAANYDRGWDKRPDKAARATYEQLMAQFN